jgi:hypothetical protein
MKLRDDAEFRLYLRQCTDAQVVGVYEKERDAGRIAYMHLAEIEAWRRRIPIPTLTNVNVEYHLTREP